MHNGRIFLHIVPVINKKSPHQNDRDKRATIATAKAMTTTTNINTITTTTSFLFFENMSLR